MRLSRKVRLRGAAVSVIAGFLLTIITANTASAIVRPSGMLVKDEDGKYYYTYYTPGTNYSDARLKYIGQPEILAYYLNHDRNVYDITNSERSGYTIHNHNLSLPCGEVARDSQGRISFFEPLGWPPGAQDQADPVFSFAENFPQYVGYVNWAYPYRTYSHHQDIIKENGYQQVGSYTNILDGGIYPFGVPNCVIVKQSNSNDYYRVFRHRMPDNTEIERKMKIPTPEMLDLWTRFNSYKYNDVDITSLPNVGNVKMPPGLLVRTVSDPTVYFTDDEGKKIKIPTLQKFDALGFSQHQIKYVQQSTLDASATKVIY